MKLYIIAGEASGDLHGSNLIKALKQKKEDLVIRAWGGDLMEAQGVDLVKHYRDLAFMGFVEVAMNLRTILRNMDFCKKDILEWKPDAVVLIDYPGFNLRIAEFAHKAGIKVIYYISPQVWAWKRSRVHKIKRFVDQMLVILPFEKEFYAEYDHEVIDVGHPLLDAIGTLDEKSNKREENIIALLPGSRLQEVRKLLGIMLTMVPRFPHHKFVIAAAPSLPRNALEDMVKNTKVEIRYGDTYGILRTADAASGGCGRRKVKEHRFRVRQQRPGSRLSFLDYAASRFLNRCGRLAVNASSHVCLARKKCFLMSRFEIGRAHV